jgi:hypothetical protein
MFNKMRARFRERRMLKSRPETTNLHEVLTFVRYANQTEMRAIINSINERPSYTRQGKEVSFGN